MSFDPKRFKKGKAGILGLGLSGRAIAALLSRKGFKVFGSDTRPREEVRSCLGKLASRITWEGGVHSDRLLRCDFVVKSPGIPHSAAIIRKLKDKRIPIFSEIEVALSYCPKAEVVAISGTNGKTTTSALAYAMIKAQRGRRAHLAGNIGMPLAELTGKIRAGDTVVLEVSSYQLEDSASFHPAAAALLNITPDHIDHHGTMSSYIESKARLFRQQKPGDSCVFNASDAICTKLSRRCRARKLQFGSEGPSVHAWMSSNRLHARLPGEKVIQFAPPKLPGSHNLENAMAAVLLALSRGIKVPAIRKALSTFRGVEHRLEAVGSVKGLRCVNDSKATNVNSTVTALKSFGAGPKDILLILGGLHKGSSYRPLWTLIEQRVKGILTIGSAAHLIEKELGAAALVFPCVNLKTAVETALKIGSKGDTLLLSPACASFDQFRNFEDRGRQFKTLLGVKA